MDELNLNQFKDLIGDLEPTDSAAFSLDDIMKEVAEEALPADEESEAGSEEPAEESDEEWEPEEEPEEAPEEEALSEPEDASEEEEVFAEPDESAPISEKKAHFWDKWVVSEQVDEAGEADEFDEVSQPEENPEEDEVPERRGFFASLLESVQVEDTDIPEEEAEDVFQEKEPKRRFWDRWLAPEKLDEDSGVQRNVTEEAAEELEETIAVSLEDSDEPTAEAEDTFAEEDDQQPTIVIEPEPEEREEPLDAESADEEPEEETEEEAIPEPLAAEPESEPQVEPEIRVKKPKFLNKWFSPIEETKEEPEEALDAAEDESPEEAAISEEDDVQEVPAEETEQADVAVNVEETAAEPTLSQAEFEAFLRETDEEVAPSTSFAELMRESGVDWQEDAPQTEAPVVSADLTSQVVYLDLSEKEEQPEEPTAPEPESEPEDSYEQPEPERARTPFRPEPVWLHLSLDRIGDIAPKVERINGEPILMGEIRRMEKEKELLRQKKSESAAQSVSAAPQIPRPVYPTESETESDDGDDEVSGGQRSDEWELSSLTQEDIAQSEAEESEEENATAPETEDAEEMTEDVKPAAPARKRKSGFSRWKDRRKKAQEARMQVPQNAKAGFQQSNRLARSMGKRSLLVGILTLFALYLSCSATMQLPIPQAISYAESMKNFYIVLILLTIAAILIAWDVLTDGIKALFHLQPDFCTLVALALLMTIVHSGMRIAVQGEEISYSCVAMAALFALMRARVAQAVARRNTYKMAALNDAPMGIYLHREPKLHLVKRRMKSSKAFVESTAKDGWHSRFERLYTPIAIAAALVLAWIITEMTGDHGRFVYSVSALLVAASQIGLLTAVALGCANATRRLMRDDAALAGLASAVRMAGVSQIVMTESDLFPTGSILIDDYVDIRGSMEMDEVLAYAAAVEGDSALGRVLKEKIHQRYGDQIAAHDHVRYKNGGSGARIGDREVLFGTTAFMEDMKIPVPALPDTDAHLFLVVDGETEAVFEVEYVATTQVYTALQSLAEHRISILFQAGDCSLSVERLCDLFGLQPGMIHVPDEEQAHQLSTPEYTEQATLLAILTRDGAAPYSDCVDTACSLNRLSAGGMLLGTLAAVLDMALMTYLCFVFAPLGASPLRVLMYSLLWFIPIFFIENEAKRG
jgi:hypothetical protein